MVTGTAAGSFVAWLPGVSSAVGTLLARLFVREEKDSMSSKEFMVSISSARTANAIFSLIALFIIGKARSGATVALPAGEGQRMGLFDHYSPIDRQNLRFCNFLFYYDLSWRQDFGIPIKNKLFQIVCDCAGRTINYGLYVHWLVRIYHIFDIHACWNDSIVCEDQENKRNGSHNASCDIVFCVKGDVRL